MKNLSGLKGCKKMARQILRQERQAGRDNYVAGQKKDNPLASGVAKPRVRSAAPWTRRYVPGSKESGTTLPEDTTKSGLTCVERGKGKAPCYVALYYNTTLQQKHKKRPTRSKTFHASTSGKGDPKAEHLPEHRAFQITLKWLWARHESCINPAPPRPSWVVEALADCSLCKNGDKCSFMEHVRGQGQGAPAGRAVPEGMTALRRRRATNPTAVRASEDPYQHWEDPLPSGQGRPSYQLTRTCRFLRADFKNWGHNQHHRRR